MTWKIISCSEIKVPLKPYKPGYTLAIVADGKGNRVMAHIDKRSAEKVGIGTSGEIMTSESPGGEINIFTPNTQKETPKTNKVALVTGSSRGLGRAIALELAKSGYDLAINSDKTEIHGEEVASEVRRMGRRAKYITADVSSQEQANEMIEKTLKEFGRLDVLVNNAGITMDKRLVDMSIDQWEKVLAINLTGAFNCAKPALKHMQEKFSGKIINISSVVGEMGNIGQANYAASKGGLIAFTKTAARESAEYGITVNAIAPGFLKTKMIETVPNHVMIKILGQIPLGRLGNPEEVAKLVCYLASDDANYITGQVININGGMYM